MQVELVKCPVCGGEYNPLRARAVAVLDGRVRAFCSNACKELGLKGERPAIPVEPDEPDPPSRWEQLSVRAALGTMLLGGAVLVLALCGRTAPKAVAAIAPAALHPIAAPSAKEALSLVTARDAQADDDLWIHPLAGPIRRLPVRDTRRFGAPREGMRPEECRGGHCGVDLGTIRGDIVMAVHDGVVERVERDPTVGGHIGDEGRFIMILHKGGTITTSYMHLDGIREDLRPGVPVKVGEAIGTVGSTGVLHSGPHLHFAISVRKTPDSEQLFIDPEPLLHLWPLKAHAIASLHRMEPSPPVRATTTARADAPASGM
ncbi:MAG TPA: peptidoglycan DD-metalloendopeptidase family protein [Polyangia bacterium]